MGRIYTKGGDKGNTSLFDQVRVSKADIRVESYGTIDELGASLGVAKNYVENHAMRDEITNIQKKLFIVAANLATSDVSKAPTQIKEQDVLELETMIDHYMDTVSHHARFVVNGASPKSAFLHLARTICRRAERRIITLAGTAPVDQLLIKYVNRLSDAIYAMARYKEETDAKVDLT